jgi:hypothetical protein
LFNEYILSVHEHFAALPQPKILAMNLFLVGDTLPVFIDFFSDPFGGYWDFEDNLKFMK